MQEKEKLYLAKVLHIFLNPAFIVVFHRITFLLIFGKVFHI